MPSMRWAWYAIAVLLFVPGVVSAQAPSCEKQLAEVQTTLFFVRASRQTSEETAGRVVATLQERLDAALKDAEAHKTAPSPPATGPHPAEPQKDVAP